MQWSKTAASNATADDAVNWAEGMAPSAVNNSARAEMASVAMWRDDISGTLTTAGSSTAYTLTTNATFVSAAEMSGAMICFIPHTTSGAAPTLSVDGLTARAIRTATGVNVPTGYMIAGTPYVVTYIHASTEFILQGGAGVFGATSVVSLTSTGGITAGTEFSGETVTGNMVATQADQETGTATNLIVTSGRQKFHPSAAKAWGQVTYSGGVPSLAASYGVTSVTDTGTGQCTINLSTAFSSANYAVIVSLDAITTRISSAKATARGTSSFVVILETCTGLADTTSAVADINFSFVAYGDQ